MSKTVACQGDGVELLDEHPPVTLFNVDRTEFTDAHTAVTDVLCNVNCFPYPSQTREQLEKVHLYLVACHGSLSDASCTLDLTPNTDKLTREVVEGTLVGAVGIVWVPFALGAMVEGYIHVVWVKAEYRRRHIGRRLLERTLSLTQGGNPSGKILRWRLHTMCVSVGTSEYLRASLKQRSGHDPLLAGSEEAIEKELNEAEVLITAVPCMYERLGFRVRRNVFKYYDGKADGIEMVKVVPNGGKRR